MKTNRILRLACILTCTGLLAPLAHAQDIRYLLTDASGELIGNSTVPGFEGAVEILSYELVVERAVEMTTGEMSNRSRNLPQFEALEVVLRSSPETMVSFFQLFHGSNQPQFTLDGVRIDESGNPVNFIRIKIQDVILSGIKNLDTEGDTGLMRIRLAFSFIELTGFEEQQGPGGPGQGQIRVIYDLTTGVAT